MTIRILDGGMLTTVQDAGRPDWTHVGVPESGPADTWSFSIANLLAGNAPHAATLEMTLVGPTFAVTEPLTIAIAGADLGARIRGGRLLPPGRSHRLSSGDIVEVPGRPEVGAAVARAGASASASLTGARAYLAVAGGLDVAVVLGSRSTCPAGGFGGVEGRALTAGDEIAIGSSRGGFPRAAPVTEGRAGDATGGDRPELVWPLPDPPPPDVEPALRVLGSTLPGLDALAGPLWRVGIAADRIGIRLDPAGPDDGEGDREPDTTAGLGGEVVTHGVPWGAIQLPPDGRPIILGPDHQTTGGYTVVGVVISADLPILGQLRPGSPVRLVVTDRATAANAARARRNALLAGAVALHEAAGWDALVDAAGS